MGLAVEAGQLIAGRVGINRSATLKMYQFRTFLNIGKDMKQNKSCGLFVKTFALLLGMFYLSSVYAEGYICIPDKATGFKFNKTDKSWYSTTFNVKNDKYILTNSSGKWKWKVVGEKDYDFGKCGDFSEYGYINCDILGTQITFNRKNLRYQSIYTVGYVSAGIAGTEGGDTPYIEIGRCSTM